MKEGDKIVVKRRFERINSMITCISYIKYEDLPEKKKMFVYGFKDIKLDKVDIFILFRCESDELFENDKLFNFWSSKYINKEIKKRDFKITGWSFVTLVKRNNFLKIQSICL